MRLATSGKGGVGKTTITGTLARIFARRGYEVLAIDGDLNPNLGITLGLDTTRATALGTLPRGLVQSVTLDTGLRKLVLTDSFDEIIGRYGVETPDGVRLLLMGRPQHAGSG
ncbi:MAG: AAA family ATPase [Candidatus Methylomirabilales bacterium]